MLCSLSYSLGIALELGLIAVKLPAPAVHAAPIQAPGTALEDPHETLKRQIAELQRDNASLKAQNEKILQLVDNIWGEVKSVRVLMATGVDMKSVRTYLEGDTKRLAWVCYMMNEHYFKPGAPVPGVKELVVLERQFQTSQFPPCAP